MTPYYTWHCYISELLTELGEHAEKYILGIAIYQRVHLAMWTCREVCTWNCYISDYNQRVDLAMWNCREE